MYQWMKSFMLTYHNAAGQAFEVKMIGIDSGDQAQGRAEPVYRFCERLHPIAAYPLKGFAQLRAGRGEKADIPGAASYKKYRFAKIGSGDEQVLEISTAYYKKTLFGRLKINSGKAGYLEFFREANDDFFIQLTNSEYLEDKGGFRDIGAHEVLDISVYAYCLSEVWLEMQVRIMKDQRRAAGMDPMTVELITNSRTVLEYIKASLDVFQG
jgi:phage terminase large subunit GpA-like protein